MTKKEERLKASFYMVNDVIKTILNAPELIETLRGRFQEAIALGMAEISVELFGPDKDLHVILNEGEEIVNNHRKNKKEKEENSNRALA